MRQIVFATLKSAIFLQFLVHFWTKNCKKTADFQVAKKICLTVNFLFYCKNQLFQTLSIAWFFKSQAFCHWGVRQPKNFRVRPPLFSNNEKKIFQHWQVWDLNPHPYLASNYASCTQPIEPPTFSHLRRSENIFNRLWFTAGIIDHSNSFLTKL